jgi:hypothetical protein
VTVIEQMQKAAIGMANEEEDAMIAGIARIMVLEEIVENTNWRRSDCAMRARMALENQGERAMGLMNRRPLR